MRVQDLFRSLRTNKKLTIAAIAVVVLLLGTGLAFRGGAMMNLAGRGAGWIVNRAVQTIAYRDKAPETEKSTASARVTVAHGPVRAPALKSRPIRVEKGEMMVPVAGAPGIPSAIEAVVEKVIIETDKPAVETDAATGDEPIPHDPILDIDLLTPIDMETEIKREDLLRYRSFGLRDPMVPLVTAIDNGKQKGRFSVYNLRLVGLAWKSRDRVALCEDKYLKSYLFREGDWLEDGGRVVDIAGESITFAHVRYGETSRHTLRLAAREGEN